MAVSVKYKDNTLFTIDSGSKTLTTQGKYCEDNIEIAMGHNLPSEYQEVEYIESTGYEAIDTGFYCTNKSVITLKHGLVNYVNDTCIYGSNEVPRLRLMWYYNSLIICNLPTQSSISSMSYAPRTYIQDIENATFSIDGTQYSLSAPTYSLAPTTLSFLSLKNVDGTFRTGYASQRLYMASVKDNGEYVVNLIPCYRKSDNVVGMYDLVDGEFYTNATGTGAFIAGGNV